MSSTSSKIAAFRKAVWAHYKKHGRHALPWRTTNNPYRILVSEVMLQQTQVERVTPYYNQWMRRFPTAKKLADAPLSEVLKAWQGLGYNRRAKMLHLAAKAGIRGNLEDLPGVGPYTARAVEAFAYNKDGIVIETNIRTAVIHHFFPRKKKVDDTEIAKILEKALPKGKSREWYSALMDYGSYLKRSGIRLNTRTKTYTKQNAFKGSNREARGALLRALSERAQSATALVHMLGSKRKAQMETQLEALKKEGLVTKTGRSYTLAS